MGRGARRMEPCRRPAARARRHPGERRRRRRDRRLRPRARPARRPAGHGPQRERDRDARAHDPRQDVGAARRRDRRRPPPRVRRSARRDGEIDVAGRRARAGAGVLWAEVTGPASEHGLAPLAGSSPDVGVVGYTLGGGLSWLSRRHGLAANSVLAIELVTADGRLVRCDRDHEPELFWALRGGGGSFGVVTAIEFLLYPAPQVYAGMMLWPWEQATEVLKRYVEWCRTAPDAISTSVRLLQVPPLPDIPEPVRGRQFVAIDGAYLGDE